MDVFNPEEMEWCRPASPSKVGPVVPVLEPDIGPFRVISIDPGFVHLGCCVAEVTGHTKDKELTIDIKSGLTETLWLVPDGCSDETQYADAVQRWVWNKFTDEPQLRSSTVLIERAYFKPKGNGTHFSHKLKLLQTVIYMVFRNKYQCNTLLIDSKQCKSALKICTGSYGGNKSEALAFTKEKLNYYTDHDKRRFNLRLDDHVADAINQMYYHLQTAYTGFRLQFLIDGCAP